MNIGEDSGSNKVGELEMLYLKSSGDWMDRNMETG